jgi:RimJ/RimL family protein N-acetyltransferase
MNFIKAHLLPSIEGKRITLRRLDRPDAPDLFNIFSNPEVMRYWIVPAWNDQFDVVRWIEQTHRGFALQVFFEWGIVRRKQNTVIGTCTLFHLDAHNRRATLGAAMDPAFWGEGLMQEAVATVVKYAFETLDLQRLEAETDPRNEKAISLLERLGFQQEGQHRKRWCVNGERRDSVSYGALREEWHRENDD